MDRTQEIERQLTEMYQELDRKRTPTEYTANEARNIAQKAISLIKEYPRQGEEMEKVKGKSIDMLNKAVAAANAFYNKYDFSQRKPMPGAPDRFRAVVEAQNGIEYFISAI